MADSTSRRASGKASPKRPGRKNFPLRIHKGTGYWCKKIKGRVYYFGKVADDPKGVSAMERYLAEKDDLEAGREPRTKANTLTVEQLCFGFLEAKEAELKTGELSVRTWHTYVATCKIICKEFGRGRAVEDLKPADFGKLRTRLAKTRGAVSLANQITWVRSVIRYASENDLIEHPVRFGTQFRKPRQEVVDKARAAHRAEHGAMMFEADEIRHILDVATQPLRAMVLLGINCGFGPNDLSCLPLRTVDLGAGWVDYPRPKTGVSRRIPLWHETIQAIREWMPIREKIKAKNKADAGLLFLTCRGARWVKESEKGHSDMIGQEFNKLLRNLGLKRSRLGFYALRRSFETVAGETTDQIVVDALMGHKTKGMAAHYIEWIGDDRRQRVVEHVRQWLFGDDPDHHESLRFADPAEPDDSATEGDEAGNDGPRLRIVG
jgi:integrase